MKKPYGKTPFCFNLPIRSTIEKNDFLFEFFVFGVFVQLNSLASLIIYFYIMFLLKKSMKFMDLASEKLRKKRQMKRGIFIVISSNILAWVTISTLG